MASVGRSFLIAVRSMRTRASCLMDPEDPARARATSGTEQHVAFPNLKQRLAASIRLTEGNTMGITRKLMSLSTLGMVSYRDKGERANRYARQTRNAARAQVAQNAAQLEVARQQLAALDHANVREEARQYEAEAKALVKWQVDMALWRARQRAALPPPTGEPYK